MIKKTKRQMLTEIKKCLIKAFGNKIKQLSLWFINILAMVSDNTNFVKVKKILK